jgi:hypothetical protein
MIALVLWTFAVLMLIPRARIRAAREKRVRAADFAAGESQNVPEDVRIPNRNFMNLLEAPVLFYVACLTVYVIGKVDIWSLSLAWLYVALRVGHSLVHLTYNHVIHRMRVYAVSIFVLMALWIRIALAL